MDYQNCPINQIAPRRFPPQHQDYQPGLEHQMEPRPLSECAKPSPKLTDRVALITGGDSGIGRAVVYAKRRYLMQRDCLPSIMHKSCIVMIK